MDEGDFNEVPIVSTFIVRFALKHQSYRIILSYNHPLGVATLSREDRYLTHTLKKTFAEIGIFLEDHIIIGKNFDYYSLKDHNLMDNFTI